MKVKHILFGVIVVVVIVVLFFIFSGSKSSLKKVVYDCNFVWPQEIINKDTGKVLWICPLPRGYCKQGTIKCCKWTEATGHYDCIDMASNNADEEEQTDTSPIKTDVKDEEPFVFDSTDSLMISCKNEIDACAVKAKTESDLTLKILKMQKFELADANEADSFFDTYKGGTQYWINGEFDLAFVNKDYPFVLIAITRIGRTGYELPFVAICSKEGKLIDKGSMFCA